MRLSDALASVQRIAVDSSEFLNYAGGDPAKARKLARIFSSIAEGSRVGITSTLTLTETLPFASAQSPETEKALRKLLAPFQIIAPSVAVAETAAQLRFQYRLKTPDAIQVATAIEESCDAFLTSDEALAQVSEIRVLIPAWLTV